VDDLAEQTPRSRTTCATLERPRTRRDQLPAEASGTPSPGVRTTIWRVAATRATAAALIRPTRGASSTAVKFSGGRDCTRCWTSRVDRGPLVPAPPPATARCQLGASRRRPSSSCRRPGLHGAAGQPPPAPLHSTVRILYSHRSIRRGRSESRRRGRGSIWPILRRRWFDHRVETAMSRSCDGTAPRERFRSVVASRRSTAGTCRAEWPVAHDVGGTMPQPAAGTPRTATVPPGQGARPEVPSGAHPPPLVDARRLGSLVADCRITAWRWRPPPAAAHTSRAPWRSFRARLISTRPVPSTGGDGLA